MSFFEDFHAELFVDEASRRAIIESHKDCAATGQWPSDHGCSSAAEVTKEVTNQLDLHVEHRDLCFDVNEALPLR